jgi:serine protease Do
MSGFIGRLGSLYRLPGCTSSPNSHATAPEIAYLRDMTVRRNSVLFGICALIIAACGSSDDATQETSDSATAESSESSDENATPTTLATDVTTSTTEPANGNPTRYDNVQPAVVQIEAQGAIRDPEVGFSTVGGRGSGFMISADGLVVTNNHVVTGAATLEVFIGGDTSKSYNATVLGVSECNDLAVIQLVTDDSFPYLSWFPTEPTVGLEVYAAGFPLGDPEFTLTRGIVSKAQGLGETSWASIDYTLEHDAAIQPGNSGGPLVTTDGTVVGINYAGGSPTNTEQFFAIDSSLAQKVVEQLKQGDFESLGINGQIVNDEELGITGLWVLGTAPGSAADKAGIAAGDIVTSLNGLPIGDDGSMSTYCDVIRTSGAGKPIDVEVLRFDTSEILSGQLNGDGPIVPTFSFADEIEDEVAVDTTGASVYSGYQSLIDDSGTLTIDVPVEWADINTAALVFDDGSTAPQITAATSQADFNGSYSAPGLFYTVLAPVADIAATIDNFAPAPDACLTDGGLIDYSDAIFTGQYHLWADCGGIGASWVVLVAVPADNSYTAVIGVQLVTEADLEALDKAFASFNVTD